MPYNLESVDNALRLIQMICQKGELRVFEAAEALGVARSTAHRILATLKNRGFVRQDSDGRAYRPGPELVQIGIASYLRFDVRRIAQPSLESLCRAVGETVHLAVLEGSKIRFIEGAECVKPLRVGLQIGKVLPAHRTAAGKALLSSLSREDVVERYAGDESDAWVPEGLLDELAEAARLGYATNRRSEGQGVAAIAAPVHDWTGQVIAAVAVGIPANRMPEARVPRLAQDLLETVRQIEQRVAEWS